MKPFLHRNEAGRIQGQRPRHSSHLHLLLYVDAAKEAWGLVGALAAIHVPTDVIIFAASTMMRERLWREG